MLQVIDDRLRGRHEAAYRCQRFAEGPHNEVDLVGQPEMAGGSGAMLAQDAN